MMYFGYILMIHIFYLLDKAHIFVHSFVVLDEVFFEIHNVLIWGFFCTVDVNVTEIAVLDGLDEG